jgi:cation transport ATPase
MNKTRNIILLFALIAAFAYTVLDIPRPFETEGGSCYQGITAAIIKLLLKVCATLSLISLISNFKSKYKTAKALSLISVLIWSLWSLLFVSNHFVYFLPFLFVAFLIMRHNFKSNKKENDGLKPQEQPSAP